MKLTFFFLLVSATLALTTVQAPSTLSESQSQLFLKPWPLSPYFSFGLQPWRSDLAWLEAVQHDDTCDVWVAPRRCQDFSWLYYQLQSAIDFDPTNAPVYKRGGLMLTVVLSDIAGASKIFDQGINALPPEPTFLFSAAYHSLFEEKNKLKAATLLEQAAKAGGPSWWYALSARLYTENGERQLAQELYQRLQSQGFDDPQVLERIQERLKTTR